MDTLHRSFTGRNVGGHRHPLAAALLLTLGLAGRHVADSATASWQDLEAMHRKEVATTSGDALHPVAVELFQHRMERLQA